MNGPLARLLRSRRAPLLAPAAGLLLTLPSLAGGLAFDDLALRARALEATPSPFARLDLFAFFPAAPALRRALLDVGLLPWFTAPGQQIAFFRPLTAALHVLDFRVFDRWPALMHAENILLYVATIALAGALYRRFLAPPVAALAALLYAVDDAHGVAVGWIADRNALVATTLGLGAVLLHDRARREGDRAARWLAPVVFALALLGGESAVATGAYLVAHALSVDPAPRSKRLAALVPYVLVATTWQLVYRRLGYGAHGSGLYLDPGGEPLRFLAALPGRAAALFLGLIALPPATLFNVLGMRGRWALGLLAAVAFAVLARALAGRLRASAESRFFAIGALLSLLPIAAAAPDDRLLLFAGLGAHGLIAQVLGDAASRGGATPPWLRRAWIGVHLVLAPLLLPMTTLAMPALARGLAPCPLGAAAPSQTVVLLNAPTAISTIQWVFPQHDAPSAPARARVLLATMGRVELAREGPRTLRVSLAPGSTADPFVGLFRDSAHPMAIGDVIEVPGLWTEVLAVDADGAPTSARYRFARDLDDPSYRFVAFDGSFHEVPPPRR